MSALPELNLDPVWPLDPDISALGLAVGSVACVSVSLDTVVGSPGRLVTSVPLVCCKAMVDDTRTEGGLVVMRVVYMGSGTVNSDL